MGAPRKWGLITSVLGPLTLLVILGVILGNGSGSSGTSPSATDAQTADGANAAAKPTYHYFNDADGFQCRSDKADKHSLCPQNPDYGKTAKQLHAEAVAKLRAEKKRKEARLAARKRRQQARLAAIRAANAWHAGYLRAPVDEYGTSGPVYLKWVSGSACQAYVGDYGCWHVQVIARDGCSSYVGIQGNEYRGGSVVGSVLDNNGNGIPPKTPISFELDADQGGVRLGDVKVSCT